MSTITSFLRRQAFLNNTRAMQLYQLMRLGSIVLSSIVLAKSGLGTSDIGVYEALTYLGTTFSFFWINGLLQAMPAVHSRLEQEAKPAFLFQVFFVFSGLSLLVFTLLFFGKNPVVPWVTGLGAAPDYFPWFCLFLLFNLPTYPTEYFYLLKNHPRGIVWWGVVGFGGQVLALALPLYAGWGLTVAMQNLAALALVRLLWTATLAFRWGRVVWRPDLVRHFLNFSAPLVLNVLVGSLVLLFDNWLVGWYYGDEALFAVFRYGSRDFPLASAMATALGAAMIPMLGADPEAGRAMLKKRSVKLFHLIFPLSMALMLLSGTLFPIVFNPEFAASAPLFNIYLLMTASRVLLPNALLLAGGQPRVIFKVGVLELLVKIMLGFVFIRWWGLEGVAWSAVAAFWVEKLGLIWYLKNRMQLPTRSWLDLKWFFGYLLALLAVYALTLVL
ncbi:MAG: polysaccharide biosynthesis C-terminal domain-containing protein [Saprospiraceae bacterium]|nr:polysaccharide biosynthesis C-terminal domain-containing protein [Saprospiraceae bacterium]